MDNLTAVAASGMRSRMQALDLLANNMANASSKGYKADREVYSMFSSPAGSGPSLNDQPWINRAYTDFSQGTLVRSGDPMDVALVGTGFLSVRGSAGPMYTRNGSLHVSPQGDLLAAENRPVLDDKGKPVKVDPALPGLSIRRE
jgi:flagellar basal-body rod protein FlgF